MNDRPLIERMPAVEEVLSAQKGRNKQSSLLAGLKC
jgi:hypothetical protein